MSAPYRSVTTVRALVCGAFLSACCALGPRSLSAQQPAAPKDTGALARIDRSGPRFGLVVLSQNDIKRANIGSQLTTVFGWQAETDFASQTSGASGVSALVIAVAGVEQGTFLPSVSWLIGFRGADGYEFGVGPNVSANGSALAAAVGVTTHSGTINIPFNLAVVPGHSGVRVSFTMGFNTTK
jgi:hypothetical protein